MQGSHVAAMKDAKPTASIKLLQGVMEGPSGPFEFDEREVDALVAVDVKKQYRTNSFEVGILTDNVEGLMYDITQKFTVGQTDFKSLNDELKLKIELGNATPNELLNLLTQRGQVTHFMEKIPSVNDIFIQTVTQN